MHAAKILHYSVDHYLERELESEGRNEYVNGEILAMTGASAAHNIISLNLAGALRDHLRGSPCRVYMNDMKLEVAAAHSFFYPDVMVSCVEPDKLQNCYFVSDAQLVIEVLSPSTDQRDREFKRATKAWSALMNFEKYSIMPRRASLTRVHGPTRISSAGSHRPLPCRCGKGCNPSLNFSS